MNSKRLLLSLFLIAAVPLASCSHKKGGGGGGGTGNAIVSITMYDTPPTGVTLLSFTLPVAAITLTPASPSTGSAIPLTTLVNTVEATRLQTDSVLLVDAASVASGTYTLSVTLGPTSATSNAFINYSGSTLSYTVNGATQTCANGAVCNLPAGALATISPTTKLTLTANQNQWIGLNLNLNNAIVTTNNTLTVDFTQSNVIAETTTLRTGLPSGAVDTIDDFSGTVTALTAGSSITVQNGITGQKLTAVLNSSTEYDTTLPTANAYSNCGSSTAINCLKVGSTVSVDATISAAGVITATEVDVLDVTAVDEIEGVIYPTSNGSSCPSGSCVGLIIADKISVSGNAVLGASTTTFGTPIFLNIASANIFAVDSKNLTSVFPGQPSGFAGPTDLLAGQQVRVQVSTMTTSNNVINATAKNMLLRWSRLTGTPGTVGQLSFTITPPAYITNLDPLLGTVLVAETFTTTYFDGVTATGNIAPGSPVSIRALMLNNTQVTFGVAKVRVP